MANLRKNSLLIAAISAVMGMTVGILFKDKCNEDNIEEAKAESFKDGVNEGKTQTVNEIKKHTNFSFAITALAYYIARCDGNISQVEQMEIDYYLNSIKMNEEIPDAIKNELVKISKDEFITFDEVKKYLDAVSVKTLNNFLQMVDDIIEASDGICEEEARARDEFITYFNGRSSKIKKYANFSFAITALAYYIARCDGNISQVEQMEIDYYLNSIKMNEEIPDAIKNELVEISEDEFITFEKVKKYLDAVDVKTLNIFLQIVDDIIEASDGICEEEARARDEFITYFNGRSSNEIKKYTNFSFAITALAYYIARCDGNISQAEQMEIDYYLNPIKINVEIPDTIKNELMEVIENEFITFDEVKKYLDAVNVKTLNYFLQMINDIIKVSDGICEEEIVARDKFVKYLNERSNEDE